MKALRFPLLALALLATLLPAAAQDLEWRHRASRGGVTVTVNPLTPSQRIAFYEARGFAPATVGAYATACGFSVGMANAGPESVHTRLADWRAVAADGRSLRLRLPADWEAEWVAAAVPAAARIAFRWAQFQAENDFAPGDWIMGMATLAAPIAGEFRLVARYRDGHGDQEVVLDRLFCAGD